MDFKLKYLKYKSKYINLKKQLGSGSREIIPTFLEERKAKQQAEQLKKSLDNDKYTTKGCKCETNTCNQDGFREPWCNVDETTDCPWEKQSLMSGKKWGTCRTERMKFRPDNELLRIAVNMWFDNKTEADKKFGPISTWDVSQVTDMSKLFFNRKYFNEDISNWKPRNVINMSQMFEGAESFNKPINNWDVSSVTNMRKMFLNAKYFNQPLDQWRVYNVTDMSSMFSGTYFNQRIDQWEVQNVRNMERMFYGAKYFNSPLNDWNVSNVTNMNHMFREAETFNQPLNKWRTSKVTDVGNMFYQAKNFRQDINLWDVSNVTNMDDMFSNVDLGPTYFRKHYLADMMDTD